MEQLPIIDPPPPPKRISRDEMNLAEFPLTILSTRPIAGIKTLEFSDAIRGKNGELINRQWIITGADKFGLPTASDDEVLLGLLKLTVDAGFLEPKVYFSRYELLKILRWTTEGRSYSRLQKALDRLSGVRIKATNAFYDNETKAHSTRNFGIIDAYEINDGRGEGAKPSFFIWSEILFRSYQGGFIKKFDLDFYLNLKSAVSKRLYRYLDKHFWYRSKIQINLFTLAHEKLGVSRNYQYASSLRQQIDPALEELQQAGFLARFEYQGKGKESEVSLYAGLGRPRAPGLDTGQRSEQKQHKIDQPQKTDLKEYVESEDQIFGDQANDNQHSSGQSRNEHNKSERTRVDASNVANGSLHDGSQSGIFHSDFESVKRLLVERGIKERQVDKLLEGRSQENLARISSIVEYFDSLCISGSRLVSRSPVGFLYRAVENPNSFVLPQERRESKQTSIPLKNSQGQLQGRGLYHSAPPYQRSMQQPNLAFKNTVDRKSSDLGSSNHLEAQYLVYRKRELLGLKQSVEPEMLSKINLEVEQALHRVRNSLSEARFKEAVTVAVEDKLAKLFAVSSFEEWAKDQHTEKR